MTKALPLEKEGERLAEWLDRGYHGEMRWMEREPDKRSDPRRLLPGTQSVISLAVNYFSPEEYAGDANSGKISRYAWGDDYHLVIKDMLWELKGWLDERVPGSESKVCVDTAPILDKAWAVRAGIGWLGKHTNVITKEFGSWVFLAELLTQAELEYDEKQVEDHCGSCTACIEACPTDAIREPYLVDSNLCISYATIELRSPDLPKSVSNNLEGWLYGCDICQEVCPWNRFEQPTQHKGFEPRQQNVSPPLDEIISLSQEDYVKRFRKSAVKRAKLSGLQRNAKALKELSSENTRE